MADDFVGPAFPKSPFQDLTAGSSTAQSVDAYRAGNPPLWGNQFAAIQTGQMRIGPSSVAYDSDGNPEGTYALILDAQGNPTGWKAEQVAPNVYDLTTTHGDYLQHMVFRTDPNYGYIEPIQNTQQQVNFGRWNYAGSGLSAMLQNPMVPLMLSTLAPGAGAAVGAALGIEGTAAATAVGNAVINAGTQIAQGKDIDQALLSAGLGIAGGALGADVNKAIDTSLADLGAAGDLAGNLAGKIAQGYVQTGGRADPLALLESGAIGEAVGAAAREIPGFDSLSQSSQRSVIAAMTNAVQGKDPTLALLNAAKGIGQQLVSQSDTTDLLDNVMGLEAGPTQPQNEADLLDNVMGLEAKPTQPTAEDATSGDTVGGGADTIVDGGQDLIDENQSAGTEVQDIDTGGPKTYGASVEDFAARQAGWAGADEQNLAASVGITNPKNWETYSATAAAYKDIFGRDGSPQEIKAYMPHEVTQSDSLDALKIYLGKKEATASDLERLDFNGDGKIDTSDVLNLQKLYLGKPISDTPSDYWSFDRTSDETLNRMQSDFNLQNNIEGSSGADVIAGGQDTISGGGQDTVAGGQENDVEAQDTLSGAQDTLTGGQDIVTSNQDTITGGQDTILGGQDTVSSNQDTLTGAQDTIAGGSKSNVEYFDDGSYRVTYDDGTSILFNPDGTVYSLVDDTQLGGGEAQTETATNTATGTVTGTGVGAGSVTGGGAKIGTGTTTSTNTATNTAAAPPTNQAAQTQTNSNLAALLALLGSTTQQPQQAVQEPRREMKEFDFESPLDVNFFSSKSSGQNQPQTTKIATGGYIHDLLKILRG